MSSGPHKAVGHSRSRVLRRRPSSSICSSFTLSIAQPRSDYEYAARRRRVFSGHSGVEPSVPRLVPPRASAAATDQTNRLPTTPCESVRQSPRERGDMCGDVTAATEASPPLSPRRREAPSRDVGLNSSRERR
ncbi:hypothetical protein F2P81_021630 [Scophthalmus maximus]|uniref:Uncharacterized protein n=1 Tax=Scophthalmus maximus TaxID=52904 RepID=A0A6A4RXY0_SCOMX|nr:hypothetical protein F2P81_021630 [Scophthalmus maximus]